MAEHAAILAAGELATATGLLALTALGRELDSPLQTALVIAGGAAISTVWLRRATDPDDSAEDEATPGAAPGS